MLKIPENKTRKRFRIAQCIFYALLVMLCSMPYIQGATTDGKMCIRDSNYKGLVDLFKGRGCGQSPQILSIYAI